MGEVAEVKKEDIFKRETKVSNPWLDPKFNKVDDLGGEPGFKVDDIPERLGLVQQGFDPTSPSYYFTDLEDTPRNYGTKLQFVQTDGKGKLSWAWPFWSKAGSTVYYKSGKVAIGHAAAQTVLHVLTPTASEVRIETSGASDPTLSLKTTNTAHQVDFALDESAVADHVDFIGQTASIDTYFHVVAQSGQTAKVGVVQGSYRGELIMGATGHLSLKNIITNVDLVFGIKDGAVNKTITWDADVDKLKHSAGLFDFDDDNLQTSGYMGLRSNAEVRFYDNGNYVGFEAPALTANQIWVLPTADGAANKTLGTDGSGTLLWRTHDELAGFEAGEHFTMLDEDDFASNSATQAATQQSIKAYIAASSQPLDAELTAIAGLTSAADKYIRFTGSGTVDLRTYANVLADLSGQAGLGFNWNSQNLSSIGTLTCGLLTVVGGSSYIRTRDDAGDYAFMQGTGSITYFGNFGAGPVYIGNSENYSTLIVDGGNISTTGTVSAGTLTLAAGSIADSSGAISFGNENLSTTGTLGVGVTTVDGGTGGLYHGLILDLTAEAGSASDRYVAIDFKSYTSGLVGQFLVSGNTYSSAGTNWRTNSFAVLAENSSGTLLLAGAGASGDIRFNTGGYALANERVRIDSAGNVGVRTYTFGTNAVGVFAQGIGTAPTTSPADSFQMYSADIQAGEAAPHFRTEHGDVIKLYQQATIADADGQLADITTKFNTLLSYLENTGLLANA